MYRYLMTIFVFLMLLGASVARGEGFAIPTKMGWTPGAKKLAEEVNAQQAFQVAFQLVQGNAPAGNDHVFGASSSFQGKSLTIMNSTSEEASKMLSQFSHSKETDAFTMTAEGNGRSEMVVVLLWDRLGLTTAPEKVIPLANQGGVMLQGEKIVPRGDVTTRVSVALAHELFGNVQIQLERQPGEETPFSRKESELRSFQAGVDFIQRVLEIPGISNAGPLKEHFEAALGREQRGLQSWESSPCPFREL